MVAPNSTPVPQEQPDYTRREEVLLDQGRATPYTLQYEGAMTVSPPVAHPHHPHPSHRGGRSLPEKSGADVSREIANAEREAAEARGEVSAKPGREYLIARAVLKMQSEENASKGDASLRLAISRARSERKSR